MKIALLLAVAGAPLRREACERSITEQVERALQRQRRAVSHWSVACVVPGQIALTVRGGAEPGGEPTTVQLTNVDEQEPWLGQALVSLAFARLSFKARLAPPLPPPHSLPEQRTKTPPSADSDASEAESSAEPARPSQGQNAEEARTAQWPADTSGTPPIPLGPAPPPAQSPTERPAELDGGPGTWPAEGRASPPPLLAATTPSAVQLGLRGGASVAVVGGLVVPTVELRFALGGWGGGLEGWFASRQVSAGTIDAGGGLVSVERLWRLPGGPRLSASLGPVAAVGLGALGARGAAFGFTGRGGLAPLGALGAAAVLRLVLAPGWEIELVARGRWLFGLVATVDGVDTLSWTGPEVAFLLGTWWRL